MSIYAYDIITTLNGVSCTSTGLITTGYTIPDAERQKLSAASLGGRIMPRILCTAVAGSGSVTLLSLDYSLDNGTRWVTGQTFSVAVSGTGEKATAASEIVCLIPMSITNVRWSTGTETLGASDSLTLVLQLISEI
jgi:hypothetical protein